MKHIDILREVWTRNGARPEVIERTIRHMAMTHPFLQNEVPENEIEICRVMADELDKITAGMSLEELRNIVRCEEAKVAVKVAGN